MCFTYAYYLVSLFTCSCISHICVCVQVDSLCGVSQAIVALHGAVLRYKRPNEKHNGVDETGIDQVQSGDHSSSPEADQIAMSADDFLPLLTFVIVHASPPNLLIVSELCAHLLDPEESIAERGYFVASLQAAVNISMNMQVEGFDLDQPMPEAPRIRKRDVFLSKVSRLSFSGT
jgi:hypothetical protein